MNIKSMSKHKEKTTHRLFKLESNNDDDTMKDKNKATWLMFLFLKWINIKISHSILLPRVVQRTNEMQLNVDQNG